MAAPGPTTAKGYPAPIVSRRVQRWVEVFAHFKNALCAAYLGIQAFVFLSMSSVDVAATRAFAPRVAALTYAALGLAHMHYAVSSWCRRRKKATASIQTISVESFQVAPPPPTGTWRDKLKLVVQRAKVSEDTVAIVFTTFELVCQSYQAIQVATFVVDRVFVFVYVIMVALHCIVSPWFLLAQPHLRAKYVLLSWSNSIFSVGLTCLLPLLGLALPVLQYLVLDQTLGNDPVWATRVILFSRLAVVTSSFGFVVKVKNSKRDGRWRAADTSCH